MMISALHLTFLDRQESHEGPNLCLLLVPVSVAPLVLPEVLAPEVPLAAGDFGFMLSSTNAEELGGGEDVMEEESDTDDMDLTELDWDTEVNAASSGFDMSLLEYDDEAGVGCNSG